MVVYDIVIAQSAAVKGKDMADGQWWKKSATYRRIRHIGFVGSAAVGDCAVSIEYGSQLVGLKYNTVAGANKIPNMQTDIVPHTSPIYAAPGEEIFLKLQMDATTNAVALFVDIEEWVGGAQ